MLLQTKNRHNMYDMLSLLQKAIRRGKYRDAAYAANELELKYRGALWSRMLVISSEDCYGVLTKEVMALKDRDDAEKDNIYLGQAVAIMCKAFKSRDACYFSCNFVLDQRCPRKIIITEEEAKVYNRKFGTRVDHEEYGEDGFRQLSLFDEKREEDYPEVVYDVAILHKAIQHHDMDVMGYYMNKLRFEKRQILWNAFKDYASEKAKSNILEEIEALERADAFVNRNKKIGMKDEIFISKAAMILSYDVDGRNVSSSEVVSLDKYVDWSKYDVKKIEDCYLTDGIVPEWTFDCHTLKGKRMGKTDWDMTTDEQAALYPKTEDYFSNASWLYTYAQDVRNGVLDEAGFEPIRKFAETHEANPVAVIPYSDGEAEEINFDDDGDDDGDEVPEEEIKQDGGSDDIDMLFL